MPDRRQHRGQHPADASSFAPEWHDALRQAVADLSWLLGRGYSETAALALVGDRHRLTARQRRAVSRCACTDESRASRAARRVETAALVDRAVAVDGFNVLVTIETALAGGLVLRARDGAHRDVASVHGSYRKVAETALAIEAVGRLLADCAAGPVTWCLDRPVSNSGRLRALLVDHAGRSGWPWTVELLDRPDMRLAEADAVVATADSWILDRCAAWVDLPGAVIARGLPGAWLLDLGPAPSEPGA